MIFMLLLPIPVEAQFLYTTNNGSITITYYFGSASAVTIPSSIDGLPVTVIGADAFYSNTGLTSIAMPDTVTTIGDEAFLSCTSLTGVILGTNLAAIGIDAFLNCIDLADVAIPKSVTNMGYQAFHNCTSLGAITVDELNPAYTSVDGVLFNKGKTTLIECPAGKVGTFTIPDSVTTILDQAFQYCGHLTDINIPNSITNTGIATFQYCSNLASVSIGTNLSNIGDEAFQYCANLTHINVPESITSFGAGAFMYCSNLGSVNFHNGVTNIGDFAFCGCTRFSNVAIPGSVIKIGGWAFNGCDLKSLTIGSGVTSIGQRAFLGCSTLTTGVTIPASVTNVGDYAFAMLFRVPGFFFLGKPPAIGESAFWDDLGAKAYYMPDVTGWSPALGDLQTALWNATIKINTVVYDAVNNGLSFEVIGNTNIPVVVEGGVDLKSWFPFQSFNLSNGSFYFSDAEPYDLSACFYRVRWP